MKCPDAKTIMAPLKPFQVSTVEHAFERLFIAEDSTSRFLVADEVGLGKTLVARGVIAMAIEHMWASVPRIDIIYICSNRSIARSNLPKLQVGTDEDTPFAVATRLTMLATQLADNGARRSIRKNTLNFVSFTPGTSFEMGRSSGHSDEREVLFHLLLKLDFGWIPLANLLQANITRVDRWHARLELEEDEEFPLDKPIAKEFRNTVKKDRALMKEIRGVIEEYFHRRRAKWPPDACDRRNEIISKLRRTLAKICVKALEPDLIILDEFQRFKTLLETREEHKSEAAELAQDLFDAITPERNPVRTLLLSATPYKLYTADAEIESEDHYADFLKTTRFLLGDEESRVEDLQRRLARFGTELKRAATGAPSEVLDAKHQVEDMLHRVMARTERVAASEDHDAMIEEPRIEPTLRVEDVRQYMAADAVFKAVGARDPMTFWKSAPYLMNFMNHYRFSQRLADTIEETPAVVATALAKHESAHLRHDSLESWKALELGHAKLRQVADGFLRMGLWKLLWLPPTVEYWQLGGSFAGKGGGTTTKTLLFSAWNVVPDAVSALISYETERRMMGEPRLEHYANPAKQVSRLLNLAAAQGEDGKRSRHRLLLLLLPCLRLADEAHPLAAPAGPDPRPYVREQVDKLLATLPDPQEGPVDTRWEWAVLIALDPQLGECLEAWQADVEDEPPNPDAFSGYVQDMLAIDAQQLGRRPEGLATLVTELALGAPGVLAARTLASAKIKPAQRRILARKIAHAFWSLFNQPAVTRLIGQFGDRRDAYWQQILTYNQDGNLQAVLDETWSLAWEQHAWSGQDSVAEVAAKCTEQVASVVQPKRASVTPKFYRAGARNNVVQSRLQIRTSLALRFADSRNEEGGFTQDQVREAFNSPFRPFLLASTSVGQEGLDFHPWCHRLVHWNLPGNPVDLEQREGRVHRYKGHAVRKNVAATHEKAALDQWAPGDDLWVTIFALAEAAARERGDNHLVPHWLAPGKHRVQRCVPLLAYTREVEGFKRLKRQLAAYRVVFGQPRQEELVTLLDRADVGVEQLREWVLDLSPPNRSESRLASRGQFS